MALTYVDSNVFFYAKIMDKKYGKACTMVLEDIQNGRLEAATSHLVVLEVANALHKYGLGKDVKLACSALLSLPLKVYPIDPPIVHEMLRIYERSGIGPYDSTHSAVMIVHGIEEIVSADSDYDRIHKIHRIDPFQYKERKRPE